MLYVIQQGDTLVAIANRFNVSIEEILNSNVLCSPDLIVPGYLLIIPDPNIPLPKAGVSPYYVIQPGDTLWCLAQEFGATVETLVVNNRIENPDDIFTGREISIGPPTPEPNELKESWNETGKELCKQMPDLMVHGIYYHGSYTWEEIGERGIPYLIELLQHPCETVRIYTFISIGRLALDDEKVTQALHKALSDPNEIIVKLAEFALLRIHLVKFWSKRIHVAIQPNKLHQEPNLQSPAINIREGEVLVSIQWYIPSPTGEEGPRAGPQIYDYVQIFRTGQFGFLPRVGFNQLPMI
ncbi:LysM peptidoglycan-binding domain-containing protein [Anaerobacillus arseniciselenatis]|nr:LysM peptidoglycan-binding domain-containing protein [Anaerobacillus arseniciselenatis]